VTLAWGFIQDTVGLIYLSIGASVAAAVVLIIAGRNTRPVVDAGDGPTRIFERTEVTAGPTPTGFPISDYDDLLVTEVVPLLGALTESELMEVRAREEAGKARTSVLRRIDAEIEARRAVPAAGDFSALDVDDEDDDDGEPTRLSPAPFGDELDEPFPIEDYDDLRVGEVLPLLPQLYADELELVAEREQAGAGRSAILERVAELLESADLDGEAPPPTPAKIAAPKKVAPQVVGRKIAAAPSKVTATKAAPKKAVATKAAPKKTVGLEASPTRKSPAKKVGAAKKAPAKKASAAKR